MDGNEPVCRSFTIAEMTPADCRKQRHLCGTADGRASGSGNLYAGLYSSSFIIVLILSMLYMKYRKLRTMQGILNGLRPAIVAMIASAGLSLFLLAVFNASLFEIRITDFRVVEALLFCVSLICCAVLRLGQSLLSSVPGWREHSFI